MNVEAPLPPLAAHRSGLPAVLDEIIARATAKNPLDRYSDVECIVADVRRVAVGGAATVLAAPMVAPELPEPENPYKGLRAFGEADAHDFFGREALTQQLLARMAKGGDLSRFLAVVGPSGSGKSSVVKAGLIPALRRGALPGSENWFVIDLLPGAHPFEELEAALLRIAVNPPESLLGQLREDSRGLLRAVRRCLPDDRTTELVLVIDQFEEVFTLVQDEIARAHLLDSLVTAALDERSRVRVIVTLRADFTDRPLRYVDFGELVQKRSEFVLPLAPDELERAIAGPAERVGLTLEPGLEAVILHDVGDQPGALPLLQYALTELFEKREDRTLTKAGYHSVGGVLGALGRRAEEVFTGLKEAEREAARQLFLRLVTLGEGTEDTRRRVLRSELLSLTTDGRPPTADGGQQSAVSGRLLAVIDAFGKSRLLTFDRDPVTRGPTVEVAHEALLREWGRLREWIQASRADVRWQRQLASAAVEWQAANRDPSFLLAGTRLAQFEGWAAASVVALTQDERVFLDASIAERQRHAAEEVERQRRELDLARKSEAAQRTSATRLRYLAIALTLFLIVAVGLTAFAFNRQAEAQRNAGLATSRELAAAALNNLAIDPERSVLLALRGLSEAYGTLLATELNGEIVIRDSASGEPLRSWPHDHTWAVIGMAFSPDARSARLATASWDSTAKIWDAATGKELFTLSGHTGRVWDVSFNVDGSRLLTVGDDGLGKVWEVASGRELLTLSGHANVIQGAAYSRDGTRIATASWDLSAKVWDATTGQELFTLSTPTEMVDVAFSPDGTRLAAGGFDGTSTVWDISGGRGQVLFTLTGHTAFVSRLVFSPDGEHLATASFDGTARVWDVTSGKEWLTLSTGGYQVTDVTFSPDGACLATGGFEGWVRVYALKLEDLVAIAEARVTRTLTAEECQKYLHVAACPGD